MQGKINEILEYCQTQGYYAKVWDNTENLKKIHISNKYLQKLSLKVIEDSKVRILTHENNRFSEEITKFVQNQKMEILPYHYDAVILTDKTKHNTDTQENQEDEKHNSKKELQRIISILEKLSPNDEVKIYTNYKGIINALKNSRQIKTKYAGTLYETIYNTIKDKQLFVHFEWVKGGVLRKKKKSELQPKIAKKLLIR
jgi:hypothetical protein